MKSLHYLYLIAFLVIATTGTQCVIVCTHRGWVDLSGFDKYHDGTTAKGH